MDDWFNEIAAGCALSPDVEHELLTSGFVIIPGPVTAPQLEQLAQAYDAAVAGAAPADVRIGSTTVRVHGLVNHGPEFDELYIYRPILEACCRMIGQPFKLSSLLARTVRPRAEAQPLHVDFRADRKGWPMIGFILLVDDFKTDNGGTRFVPRSHTWSTVPSEIMHDPAAYHEQQVLACGPAGSVIVYNGSVWHGHTSNHTDQPRRSIQGAYIRRETETAVNQAARIRLDTLRRIGSLAKYVLAVKTREINGRHALRF
ncbi:MAG TPA: phytanoyl-CoA dioxygenase family protein [Pyrinomonadaceae bacterium]|nr:phytanoyl-CoA dioxygenase family protein [Pyrinomonadaceae bacterium]